MSASALCKVISRVVNLVRRPLFVGLASLAAISTPARAEDTLFYAPHSSGQVTPLNGATGAAGSTLISGLSGAHDIARTPQGDFVVALASADRVSKYSSTGSLVSSRLFTVTAPAAIAVGHDGAIYVANGNRISKYSSTGSLVSENFITNLSGTADLAIDYKNENLYVVQKTGNRVTRHKLPSGTLDTAWQADITAPQAVAVTHAGRVYVAAGSTVTRYTLPAITADAGFTPGVLSSPARLAFGNNSGRLYVGLSSGPAALLSLNPDTGALSNILAGAPTGDASLVIRESGAQTIYFPQPADVYITALEARLFATSTSGLPVRFELAAGSSFANIPAGSDSLNPSAQLLPTAIGTVTVRAIQDGDSGFAEATPVERTFSIIKVPQTITFPAIPDVTVNGSPVLLTATASSGLSVSYSIVSGSGTLTGGLLRATGPGAIVIEATQAGDDRYDVAPAVQRSATASKQSQTITFEAIPDQTFGSAPFAVGATSSVGLPVTIAVTSGPASITNGILSLTGIGSVELTATQTGNSSYDAAAPVVRTFSVLSSTQTISFPSQSLTFGGSATLSATATSGLPVTFTLISGPGTLNGTLLTANGVGTIIVEANQAGNANVAAAAPVQTAFVVGAKGNVINFPAIDDTTFGTGPVALFATATSGLPITYTVVSGPANVAGSTLQLTGGGTVVVRASQNGGTGVSAATPVERSFSVARAVQTIAFPQPSGSNFSGSSIVLSATTSSGLPVVYSLDSGLGSITGANLTPVGAGDIVIRASQPGNSSYLPATAVLRTVTITRAAQTITFGALPGRTFAVPGPSFNLGASAGSGLPVSFEIVSGPATLQGAVLTLTGAGQVLVRATQAGNDNYLAALPVERDFAVAKAVQSIAFEPVANRTFSDVPVSLGAVATSGLAVGYEIVSGPAAIENGLLSLKGAGTVVVRASQAGDDNFLSAASVERSIAVAKAAQTITFAAPAGILYTDPAFDLVATSSSGLPVVFTLVSGPASLEGKTLTPAGTGTVIVRATQAGDDNFLPAGDVQRSFRISAAEQTIDFPEFAPATYGDGPLTLSAFADSGLPVSFSLVSGPGALSGDSLTITGAGSIVVRASQRGNTAYRAATPVERTLVVAKAAQTIDFPVIADRLFSPVATPVSASSSSGLPVALSLIEGPGALAGSALTPTGTGTVVLEATQAGDENHLPATPVRRSFAIDAATATVTLGGLARTYTGEPLAATVTTEPAGLAVTVTYLPASSPASTPTATPPAAAGSYLVAATVTTEGSIGSATGTLVIAKAPLTVTANDAVKLAGTVNPELGFSYAGFLGDDTPAVLVATPVVSTTAAASSPVGTYPITVSGGGAANYTLVHVAGTLRVVTYSGPYETLLFSGAGASDLERSKVRLPVGLLEITVPATGADFTGRVTLAGEPSAITIKGRFALSEGQNAALATVALTGKPTTNRYTLELSLGAEGLAARLLRGDVLVGESDAMDATQLFVAGKTNPAPWSGAHTLILDEPFPIFKTLEDESLPLGAGYATAKIAASGVLTVSGRLPDGTTLSGSAKAGVDGSYRVFIKPYGTRLESYFGGPLKLALHPDINNRYRSTEESAFVWTKAPNAKDATYRGGIPVSGFAHVALDPWQPPLAKTKLLPAVLLTDRLGLGSDGFLQLEFELPAPTETILPELGELTPAKRIIIEQDTAPGWSVTVAPATGLFTGKVTFRDPSGTKTVSRTVKINGILRQATKAELAEGDALLGAGQLRIPVLGSASPTPTTGALRLYTPPGEKE